MPTFKTEHDMNAFLTAKIKKLGTSYKSLKMSDRFKVGIADFLIFHDGRCVAAECKFVSKIPSKGRLLSHPLKGPQVTFMKTMQLAGVNSFVLLGIGEESCIYVIQPDMFDEEGNILAKDFRAKARVSPGFSHYFFYDDINDLVDCMLLKGVQNETIPYS